MAELGLVISHRFKTWSPAALRLATAATIWSLRSFPEPLWLAAQKRRRIFHWGLGTSLDNFHHRFKKEGLDHLLSEKEVELFSFDLGPAAGRHLGVWPVGKAFSQEEILRRLEAAVGMIRKFYSGPLAVENYNFYPTGLYHKVTEPQFIARCLAEFDLGLTLDLAHAAVTAHNLNCFLSDYLAALPLEKTVELHLSRPQRSLPTPFWALDAHRAPKNQEWLHLKNILKTRRLPKSVRVFIEYYGNLSKLEEAQAQLSVILAGDKS